MDTRHRSPQDIFIMPQRLLVPLFQRPYVWNEELQWEPLWRDLQRVATRLLVDPNIPHQPHFLGAVVFQQLQNPAGDLQQRTVIDGQQRLTTLQILFDSIHAELVTVGADAAAARLNPLIENSAPFCKNPEDRFKVWPTNKDRPAFNEVMATPQPIDYKTLVNANSRLVQAHQFFSLKTREWLLEEGNDQVQNRATALEKSARELLQIVVIDLTFDENAQEIFETLNSRGAVLTAADLIKNFIFQRLIEQGTNVEKAYSDYWKTFENSFWEQEVSAGRVKYQRSSLFINHWLISKTGEEVLAREVFSRFKSYADYESRIPMLDLLKMIHAAATKYEGVYQMGETKEGALDAIGLFAYRLKVLESDVFRPFLIYLLDPEETPIEQDVLSRTLAVMESWLVRRMLVRATTKRYNQFVPEIISAIRKDRANAAAVLEKFLTSQNVDSSYWPDDLEIKEELTNVEAYRKLYRSRLRMVFESIEDHLRGWSDGGISKSGMHVPRNSYAIEHLMPQSWERNWPLPDGVSDYERNHLVQTLGNLTLLSSKLNASVSNGPWLGLGGKREALDQHDLLSLNKRVQDSGAAGWTEDLIINRTQSLIEIILNLWRVPIGHVSKVHRGSVEAAAKVNVIDLISAGLINPGQVLYPKMNAFEGRNALVLADGRIEIEGKIYESLSLSAIHLVGRNTNGWTWWLVDDRSKKSMDDLRQEYRSMVGSEISSEDSDDSSVDELQDT